MRKKVIGVGAPLVDILASVSEDYIVGIDGDKGGMVMIEHAHQMQMLNEIANHEMAPGGSASNTIIGLLNLGAPGALLGKLGNDDRASYFADAFTSVGGDKSAFKYCGQTPTGTCLSLVTPDAERTLRPYLGASAGLQVHEVSVDDFRNHDHAHIEGYLLFNRDLALKTLKSAKEAGCTVSVDLASFEVVLANKDILPEIFENYVDMIFANEEEAKAWCDSEDPHVALDSLAQYCETVAVKLGAEGAWISHNGVKSFTDAHKINAIDTTGAGDLWASGFLYGILSGLSVEASAQLASKCGSEVVQIMGAVIPDHGWSRIKNLLNEFK